MSYIIAYVKSYNSREYPVECFRTDLRPNDKVLVTTYNDKVIQVTVVSIKYLNWRCRNKISCKVSEAVTVNGRLFPPYKIPIYIGLARPNNLMTFLEKNGWYNLDYGNSNFKAILVNTNNSCTTYIMFRQNGIDIELMSSKFPRNFLKDDTYVKITKHLSFPNYEREKYVRHYYAHTTFNLLEGIARYSSSFMNNESNLDRYFSPVGEKDRRTEELKKATPPRPSSILDNGSGSSDYDEKDYDYGEMDGSADGYDFLRAGYDEGEPVYLCDGMWI